MPRLTLTLFGAFVATLDGQPVTSFESHRVRALLAFLAMESAQPHSRDALAGLLWPEEPDRVARDNLRQALANLRLAIGDRTAETPLLLVNRDTVQLNPAADCTIDARDLEALLTACQEHRHRHADWCRSCAGRLAQAVELYRDEFLARASVDSAPFEEWVLLTRERLHAKAANALHRLAAYQERRGDYEQALRYVRRLLALDPWREEAHRQARRCLALSGQRAAALAQYERCREVLARDLAVEPCGETTALYERIRSEEFLHAHAEAEPDVRADLPIPLTPLVGRERELAELCALLEDPSCRLVTVTGPGGIGKTRLALQAAAEEGGQFAHGVCFVPLAGLDRPDDLAPTIAAALGVPPEGPAEPSAQLLAQLRDKEHLLILDSVEHLLPDSGRPRVAVLLLSAILRAAPKTVLLVTSIERLGLQGERVLELEGLAYPSSTPQRQEAWASYGALALFLYHARRAQPGLALSAAEREGALRVCRLVQGMPLAIELAAAWAGCLACTAIAGRIEKSLDILTSSLRDVPARHRSLQAVFDRSWELLSEEERRVLARLSLFEGGFEEGAAAQVAGAPLPVLRSLVNKSALRARGDGRYDSHELMRQYAMGRLQAGEAAEAASEHLSYFVALAEAAGRGLAGPDQRAWLDRCEREHANLHAALHWALANGRHASAARLCCPLWRFWLLRGHLSAGRHWLRRILNEAPAGCLPAALRAQALNAAGTLASYQGDYGQARAACEESLALCRGLGDAQGEALALGVLGLVDGGTGDLRRARALLGEALAIWRRLGDAPQVALAGYLLGAVALLQLDMAGAQAGLEEGLALARELGHRHVTMEALRELGMLRLLRADVDGGRTLLAEALAVARELGYRRGAAQAQLYLGWAGVLGGDPADAGTQLAESLAVLSEIGDGWHVTAGLLGLAEVAAQRGLSVEAARLCGAAEALGQAKGSAMPPLLEMGHSRVLDTLRACMPAAALDRARAEGQAMPLAEAVAQALALGSARPNP